MLPFLQSLTDEQRVSLYGSLTDECDIEVPGFESVVNDRDGSDTYVIFRFDGRLYRLDGYYDSWNGGEWEGLESAYEVEEKDKVIKVYPKKA